MREYSACSLRVAFLRMPSKGANVHQVYGVIVAELKMKPSSRATFQCHESYVSCQRSCKTLPLRHAMPTTTSISISFPSIFNQSVQRATSHEGGLFDATFMRFSQRICWLSVDIDGFDQRWHKNGMTSIKCCTLKANKSERAKGRRMSHAR